MALPENDEVFLAKRQQRVDLCAAGILPHIDLGMSDRILDHPAHPADPLAATQIRQTIIFDATFLYQMPKRRPSARRFRMATATDAKPLVLYTAVGNLGDEDAVELGFICGPVAPNAANGSRSGGFIQPPPAPATREC